MASVMRSNVYLRWKRLSAYLIACCALSVFCFSAHAQENLSGFIETIKAEDVFPGAVKFGDIFGDPGAVQILDDGNDVLGHAILNTDYVPSVGYSGKPIFIVIGVDKEGVIRGAKMVKHSEPIVLAGIPLSKIEAFIDGFADLGVKALLGEEDADTPDIVASATVTVIVIEDSIRRAVTSFARTQGLGGLEALSGDSLGPQYVIQDRENGAADWDSLLGEGSIRRLLLNVGEINAAFEETGHPKANRRRLDGEAQDLFIDMYVALVSVPSIGRALLGDAEFDLLQDKLAPDQHAILIMANGQYSFRGSGFVRGGIFDRFQLLQDDASWLFRDKAYKRIGALGDEFAPKFDEIGLFLLPDDGAFEPTKPWRIQLLINRAVGPLDKIFVQRDLSYNLPKAFLKQQPTPQVAEVRQQPSVGGGAIFVENPQLLGRIWAGRQVEIVIISIAIVALTCIFFFQMQLARRPKLLKAVRGGFLVFTLVFIGGYAGAQLSVVNVFTFIQSLMNDFSWDYFLRDPLIFILWFAVAASLIFWGRGAFCGWLCPFGALQELLNMGAKRIGIPQFQVPWGLHERLWPIKYVIFLSLFGLSLYSLPLAEELAEIEPFKTAIVLKFAREWPFVIYALTLLSVGLFIERFFCRYLCPLGAALALPGKMRINDWLKRYKECGSPCHRCAKECMVQAIHPEGHINVNECLYCLHCQELYNCGHRCPVVKKKWERREKIARMSKPLEHGVVKKGTS